MFCAQSVPLWVMMMTPGVVARKFCDATALRKGGGGCSGALPKISTIAGICELPMSNTPSGKRRSASVCFPASSSPSYPLSVDNTCGKQLAGKQGALHGTRRQRGLGNPAGATGMFHTMTTVRGLAADATGHMGHGDGRRGARRRCLHV